MNRYLPSMKRHIWIVLVCTLLAAFAGLFLTKLQPVAYQASATMFVNAGAPGTTYPGGPTSTDSLGEATNYAAMITSRSFMQNVLTFDPNLQKLGYTADDLLANTLATPSSTVPTITIATTVKKPGNPILLANDIAASFQAYITTQNQQQLVAKRKDQQTQLATYQKQEKAYEAQLLQIVNTDPRYPIIVSNRDSVVRLIETAQTTLQTFPTAVTGDVTVIQQATSRDVIPTSKPTTTMAITCGVGLLVGILIMLLFIYLDPRLRLDEEVKEKLGLSYIGGISRDKEIRKDPTHITGSSMRELEDIAANLSLSGILREHWTFSQGATLLVTSAQAAEGKTSLAAALAATIARAGFQVVVVDGNLKHPSTHLALKVFPSGAGLCGLIRSSGKASDALVRTNIPNLWLLPAGGIMENSALLLSQKLPALLTQLRSRATIIIIDGPALLNGAEANILANMVDGVILVFDTRHSKMPLMLRAKTIVNSQVRARVGVILNYIPRRSRNHYFVSILPEAMPEQKEMSIQDSGSTPRHGQRSLYSYTSPGHIPSNGRNSDYS